MLAEDWAGEAVSRRGLGAPECEEKRRIVCSKTRNFVFNMMNFAAGKRAISQRCPGELGCSGECVRVCSHAALLEPRGHARAAVVRGVAGDRREVGVAERHEVEVHDVRHAGRGERVVDVRRHGDAAGARRRAGLGRTRCASRKSGGAHGSVQAPAGSGTSRWC